LVRGRFASTGFAGTRSIAQRCGESIDGVDGPRAVVLADDEFERVRTGSRTFRTDGERVEVVQLRVDRARLRVPIGLVEGPIELPGGCWDAARAMFVGTPDMLPLIEALASAGVVDTKLAGTL